MEVRWEGLIRLRCSRPRRGELPFHLACAFNEGEKASCTGEVAQVGERSGRAIVLQCTYEEEQERGRGVKRTLTLYSAPPSELGGDDETQFLNYILTKFANSQPEGQ